MSVLVTHAHNRLAYYTTRCLARHGVKVTCASEFPLAATFFSKYCTDHFTYPSPWKQPDQFVQKILEEIERRDIDVLMPVHREGYVLAKYKETVDRSVKFPVSAYPKIDSVNDKRTLIRIAKKQGIRTPKTIAPDRIEQIEEATSNLHFPVTIKLARGHGGIGMSIIEEPEGLLPEYMKALRRFNITSKEEYPIIQEFINGIAINMGILFNQGRFRAKYSEYPSRFGYRIEYESPEATSYLSRLGRNLDWHGMISGTFILEEGTRLAYLTDINPRFWGGLSSAIMAGVEFPFLLYLIAINGDVEPVLEYRRGSIDRWLWADLSNIPRCIWERNWNQILEILTCQANLDFWDRGDPVPFFTLPLYPLAQMLRTGTPKPLESY